VRMAVGLLALAAMVPFVPALIRGGSANLGELALRIADAFK
jgi:hypothetical protein